MYSRAHSLSAVTRKTYRKLATVVQCECAVYKQKEGLGNKILCPRLLARNKIADVASPQSELIRLLLADYLVANFSLFRHYFSLSQLKIVIPYSRSQFVGFGKIDS